MAGIYLHIPFCKQACHYCDFHFSTSLINKPAMVKALMREMDLRKNYLSEGTIYDSIYFGGGTPSLLSEKELQALFEHIYKTFKISTHPEITLEANPDDLTKEKLKELKVSPVNRLSIGIQSFSEEDLRWMNRAHNAKEASNVLDMALDAGFEDLTADLIYGFPLLNDQKWEMNMNKMMQSGIRHFSAYNITVEKGTPLSRFIEKKQQPEINDEQGARQFKMLMETATSNGWEQYEISNYAKDRHYSRHNTAYWQGIPYIGIGPSAHSYNLESRQWNIRINNRYIQSIEKGKPDFQLEFLTRQNHFDEYVMIHLRTMWGIDLEKVGTYFGETSMQVLIQKAKTFEQKKQLQIKDHHIVLTNEGKLFADYITSELFE